MEESRANSQTPRKQHSSRPKKKKTGTVWKVLGTLFAIGLVTGLMFFGIFMVYVNTTLEPELDVDISAYTLKQSSTVYYQDKATGEWVELTKLHGTENRTLVDFEDIPDHVWEALVFSSMAAWTGRARRAPFSIS